MSDSKNIFSSLETERDSDTVLGVGERCAEVMSVTKSVNFPVNDRTTVTLTKRTGEGLAVFCKKVKAVKSRKDGKVVRHLYVPDWIALEAHGLKKLMPLWHYVVMIEMLDRTLKGEGRIHHDGSDSFLPGNFSRDAWPEVDETVLTATKKAAKTKMGQTSEALRLQQQVWLDDATLYEMAVNQTNRNADVFDAVQAGYEAALKQISAGRCNAKSKSELCGYLLATCYNQYSEMVRRSKANRKTHKRLTEKFEDGEQHHVKRTAPTPKPDDISPKFDSALSARS